MTVNEIVEKLKTSQGFVLFVSYMDRKDDGTISIEHQYIRNTFVPEDLEETFKNFTNMVSTDLKESGARLVNVAEKIANEKFPLDQDPNLGIGKMEVDN